MQVDAREPQTPDEVFVLLLLVVVSLQVQVLLREAEIDQVDPVVRAIEAHIIRLDIPVDESDAVQHADLFEDLNSDHQDSFEAEFFEPG